MESHPIIPLKNPVALETTAFHIVNAAAFQSRQAPGFESNPLIA